MIDFDLLKRIIQDNNSFLLTTHVNPDGDAIGSEIAFYFILTHCVVGTTDCDVPILHAISVQIDPVSVVLAA